jgi:RNA polymerase sigma factor (sigma-70 family)
MVVGAALRRTGDVEAARDVAQQVFSTLAVKAPWLAGRTSIAGWLYVAASHIAMRAARSEMRRRAAMERFADEKPQSETMPWDKVEDALAALGETDREALVLHYFQDLGYAEMAAQLHIAEPAARKRVSRALGALEQQLARRGIAASAIGLLASATALQAGVPAHAGLATAALTSGGSAAPALLTFTTIMSHTTTKIAAAAILLAAVPVAITSQANSRLRAETAAAVQASSDATPTHKDSGNVRENPATSAKPGEALALSNQLAAEQTRRKLAEDKVAALTQQIERARNEVVVSLGQIEDIARRLASFGRMDKEFEQRKSVAPPAERARLAEEFAAKASSMFPEVLTLSNELPKIESSPEKAGRFYATLIGELAELTPAQRDAVAKVASKSFESMRQLGVTAGQRPAKENAAWTAARTRAINAMQEAILQVLPSDKRDRSLLLEGPMDFISDPWHWDSQREGEKK